MKTNLLGLGLIACVALIGVTQVRATDIQYHVDVVCGLNSPSGSMSVTGTITTNGTLGPMPLTQSDIINWNLTIKNTNGAQTLSGPPGNVGVSGPTLTASSSFLSFDYFNQAWGQLVFGNNAGTAWENFSIGYPTDGGYSLFYVGPTAVPNPFNR
jgi:hypothetical protein